MMNKYSKVVRSFSDPDIFFRNYPDFHIFIDLKGWDENVKTYFSESVKRGFTVLKLIKDEFNNQTLTEIDMCDNEII